MSDVFISYSRKDKVFARRLFDRLKREHYSSWADWIGIPYSAEWMGEIRSGIIQADNFVFIISPDSMTSKICQLEIEIARQHNKRIIPIVRREPSIKDLAGEWFGKDWEAIARANWDKLDDLNFIFFRKKAGYDCHFDDITHDVTNPECDGIESDADDFEISCVGLMKALREQPDHARKHTRYLLRAIWDSDGQLYQEIETNYTDGAGGIIELSDGRILVWGNNGLIAYGFDEHGQSLFEYDGHTSKISGMLELAEGRILSWSEDDTLRIWQSYPNLHDYACTRVVRDLTYEERELHDIRDENRAIDLSPTCPQFEPITPPQ